MSHKELSEQLRSLTKQNQALNDLGLKNGGLTAEQEQEWQARDEDIAKLEAQITEAQEKQAKQDARNKRAEELSGRLEQPMPRQTTSQLAKVPANKSDESVELTIGGKPFKFAPGTVNHLRSQPDYNDRFIKHILTGKDTGLSDWQSLGLTVGTNPKGGYLVPMTFLSKIIRFLDQRVFMRELATVISGVSSSGLGVPTHEADPGDADWTTEILSSDASEDDTMSFGKREMTPQDLMKVIYVSRRLLDGTGSVIDIEDFVAERLGYKFAVTEEKAGMTGAGVTGWLGIFVASADGITTAQDIRSATATTFDGDDIIEMADDLDDQYKANSTWVFGKAFLKRCRKLKTSGSGEYIWESPFADNPATVAGRPYKISSYAPSTYTANQYVAVLGDFKAGYWIADGMDMTVERDDSIRRLKKQAVIVGEKSSDGAPVLAEAFRRLQMHA